MQLHLLIFVFVSLVKYGHFQAPTCTCVPKNQCYQNLTWDGSGSLDVRIVSPTDSTTTPAPPPPTTTNPGVCGPNYDACCSGPSMVGCGLRYNVPPVNGIQATSGQAKYGSQPWQAIILGVDNTYIGGGALLDSSNVVTAAHKVAGRAAGTIKVRLGEWNASSANEPFPVQDSAVSAITIHPSYTASNLFNDVAVLRLATPINLDISPVIDTVCLPPSSASATVFDGLRCLVAGWGKDAYTGNLQYVEKEVEVPVVPFADCQTKLRNTKLGPLFSLDQTSFMCAGGEAGRDACTGDGGAALSCIMGGRYYLAGLVSWGIGCADANVPGVYVKILSYVNWITNITSK